MDVLATLRSLWQEKESLVSRIRADAQKIKELKVTIREAIKLGDLETAERISETKDVLAEEISDLAAEVKALDLEISQAQSSEKNRSLVTDPSIRHHLDRRVDRPESTHYTQSSYNKLSDFYDDFDMLRGIKRQIENYESELLQQLSMVERELNGAKGFGNQTIMNILKEEKDSINSNLLQVKKHLNSISGELIELQREVR